MENLAAKNRRVKIQSMMTKKAIQYRKSLNDDCVIADCLFYETCDKQQIEGENVKCVRYKYKLSKS